MTRRIGFSYGLAERKLDQVKKFSLGERSWDTDTKVYKVLEYLPGENIWTAIHKPLTEVQQLIIAIKWCQALKNVHKNRIIHRDAKEDNANVLINGNDIQVKCSDYGYAVELLDGQDESHDYTIGGSAPEVKKLTNGKPIFSTKSDVHSLGISFQRSFSAIPKDIIDGMLRENRFERDSLDVVSNKLAKHLSTKQNLDSHAIKVITDLGLAKPSSQRKPAVLPSQDTKTKSKSKSSFFKSFINDKRSAKELVIAAVIIVGVIGIAALIYKKMKIRKKMKKMRKYVSGFTL